MEGSTRPIMVGREGGRDQLQRWTIDSPWSSAGPASTARGVGGLGWSELSRSRVSWPRRAKAIGDAWTPNIGAEARGAFFDCDGIRVHRLPGAMVRKPRSRSWQVDAPSNRP